MAKAKCLYKEELEHNDVYKTSCGYFFSGKPKRKCQFCGLVIIKNNKIDIKGNDHIHDLGYTFAKGIVSINSDHSYIHTFAKIMGDENGKG